MKKKLFSYLMLAFAIMGAGLVGSCNDYCEDLYDEYRLTSEREDTTLSQLIQQLQAQLKACQLKCQNRYKQLSDSLKNNYTQDNAEHATFATQISALQAQDVLYGNAIDSIISILDTLNTSTGGAASTILYTYTTATQALADAAAAQQLAKDDSIDIEALKQRVKQLGDSLVQVYQDAAEANALATRDSIFMYNLKDYVDSVDSVLLDSISAVAKIAKENLDKAKEYARQQDSILQAAMVNRMDSIQDVLHKADSLMQDSIDSLAVKVKKNTERIEVLEDTITSIVNRMNILSDSIKAIDQKVDSLFDAEKKRITSLLVQGTINPAFGSFSLPVGIRSNVLMGYYGQFDSNVSFPAFNSTAHTVDAASSFTLKEIQMLAQGGFTTPEVYSADAINADTMSAGKFFFTVNPNEVELDSTYTFTFVNSLGDTCAAQIGEITPSTEKLTFGYTKAGVNSPNGFYEAPVTFKNEDAASLTPNVDKDALKAIAKDILSWRDGIDLATIAPNVMKAFDGVLDAQALNVTWTDSLGTHNVKSQYEVAVAAVRPLSYNTLADFSISRTLPTLPDLSGITINVDTLAYTPLTFTINDIPVFTSLKSVSINDNELVVSIEIPVGSGTYYEGHAHDSFAGITHDIDAAVDDNIDSIRVKINNFIAEIRTQVANMTTELNGVLGDVNDMIRDAKGQVDSYVSTANSYVTRVNSWINRINNKISGLSPDVLLQPTVLYEGADGNLHQVSGSSVLPTNLTGAGAINLCLTSYSAELLAPAYKKFVGVTNVINMSDPTKTAQDGDGSCSSMLIAANGSADLCKVLPGDTKLVTFQPGTSHGYIYEIAYSAIDYNGWISTRKFYVAVP